MDRQGTGGSEGGKIPCAASSDRLAVLERELMRTTTLGRAIAISLALLLIWTRVDAQESKTEPEDYAMNDFSILPRMTVIHHQRLEESMVDSDEWTTFETNYEAWEMLDGAASLDRVFGEVDGRPFEGVSVRSLDRETNEWTIYWMDVWNTNLRIQVQGRFEAGVGTFYGTEVYRGVEYRMRFLWKRVTESQARWEQAYQNPDSGDWETNWIMDFYESQE